MLSESKTSYRPKFKAWKAPLSCMATAGCILFSSNAQAENAPNFNRCGNQTLQLSSGSWLLWGNYASTFSGLSDSVVYQGIDGKGRATPRRYKSIETLFGTVQNNYQQATRIFCHHWSGGAHAVLTDGTIVGWGYNQYGQLGVGDTIGRTDPTGVLFMSGQVADIKGGQAHTVALLSDGNVFAWGNNSLGQIGDGSTVVTRSQPVQIAGLNGVKAIATGFVHTLALMSDGTVRAWGGNTYGQLGFGNETGARSPGLVVGLNNVVAIAADKDFSLALKSDGTVWGWGFSYFGETGTSVFNKILSPIRASSLSEITQIVAGDHGGFALDSQGRVWGWGDNDGSRSLLGENRTSCFQGCLPEIIPGLPGNISKIYTGRGSAMAWASDGRLFAWGDNYEERLGLGVLDASSSWIPDTAKPQLVRLGIAQSDFNRDHTSDILFRNSVTGDIWLWGMKDLAITENGAIGSITTDWQIVGTGDVDGDGHDDLFWRNAVTGGNAIWLMNNRQVKAARTLDTVGDANWKVSAIADLNGDGRADMIWRNEAAGMWAAWLIGDDGVLQTRAFGGVPADWEIRGAADFTGDARADIIWRHKTSGAVVIYRMEGTLISGVNFLMGGPAEWDIVGITDTDRDGRAEILFRYYSGSSLAEVQLNDDATAISQTRFVDGAGGAWNVAALGDYDGDTHTDILWRNAAGELVLWRLVDLVLPGTNSVQKFANVRFLGNPGNVWQVIGK